MGWLSKAVGKALGGIGLNSVTKLLGLGKEENLSSVFDAQLRQQREASKLDAANEATNVVQFEDTSTDTGSPSTRRTKKRSAGAYASALGLKL